MKFKIVTDASCDMPQEYVDKYDITILPIEVRFGDELYPNGLPSDEFYKKLRTSGIIPKTSQPNQYKFETAYSKYVNKDDWFVLTIIISSGLAGTITQAKNATEALKMKNNYICDSGLTTYAQGAIIVEICKFIETCKDVDKVIARLEELKKKARLYAIIGDLKYLKQGGRLSSASYFVASTLKVRPIITLEDGVVKTCAKKVGAQADKFLIDMANTRDTSMPLYFGHADCKKDILEFVNKYGDKMNATEKEKNTIYEIGCVVGTHAGPDCYGILFFEK